MAIMLDAKLADAIERELDLRLETMARHEIARRALAANGAVLVADSVDAAIDLASEIAPEHLMLILRDANGALARVRNAGTVFLGDTSSVAFGDYMTGANHVLPTGGTARWSSGLSPLDFVRWTTYQRIDSAAAISLADDVALLAASEGLPAHALAARSAAEATR
jgi:histidinol dehydrogenase